MPMGQDQAARPIVFSPPYPLPEFPDAGFVFPPAITFIGDRTIGHCHDVWEAVRIGGADLGLGRGDDRVPFDVLRGNTCVELVEVTLPLESSDTGYTAPRYPIRTSLGSSTQTRVCQRSRRASIGVRPRAVVAARATNGRFEPQRFVPGFSAFSVVKWLHFLACNLVVLYYTSRRSRLVAREMLWQEFLL